MKNKLLLIKLLIAFFLTTNLFADSLEISSTEIRLDKKDSKIILVGPDEIRN